MKKYLLTIEFRYSDAPKFENDLTSQNKTVTIGVFDEFDTAAIKGNEVLEVFEKHFKLNSHYNRKERFSKNGGCFGSPKTLITDLAYLQTPFSFYAKIETLNYLNIEQTILDVIESAKRYKEYKLKEE